MRFLLASAVPGRHRRRHFAIVFKKNIFSFPLLHVIICNMDSRRISFFAEHEKRINYLASRILLGISFLPVIIHIVVCLKYYNISYNLSLCTMICSLFICLVIHLLNRFYPDSRAIKYIGIFLLQIPVFAYSIDVNIQPTVSNILAVIFSLLYFNYHVTIFASILSIVSVVTSTIITSSQAVEKFWPDVTPLQYVLTTGTGRLIEMIVASVILISVSILSRNLLMSLYKRNERISTMQNQVVFSFADIIESRDGTTGEHVKRTSRIVALLSEYICNHPDLFDYDLSKSDYELITMAAPLHDIGKMKVPDAILSKPAKLDEREFDIIKTHSLEGAKIIDKIMPKIEDPDYVKFAREMALSHHEKWNGKGYPQGLEKEEIPVSARIMAVADVFDALCSMRSYKLPYTVDEAFKIMIDSKGSHFEPALVDAMIALKPKLEEIYKDNKDK